MNIEEIAFADGMVKSVSTCRNHCEIFFLDWREVTWRLRFENVLAVENLNIEGEDIHRLEIGYQEAYVARVRRLVDEPDEEMNVYNFYSAWQDEPRLRIVASSCTVSSVTPGEYQSRNADNENCEE